MQKDSFLFAPQFIAASSQTKMPLSESLVFCSRFRDMFGQA